MEGLNSFAERQETSLFERIPIVGDPLRCRILLLLEDQELTVSELCSVLQLPQSTVSRHLKTLMDDGWIQARPDGPSRWYSGNPAVEGSSAQRLWLLLREEIAEGGAAAQDLSRLNEVLVARRTRSQEFFSTAAGAWAEMRRELFGERFDVEGLLGLLDEGWTVADLGCGTGQTAEILASFVRSVIGVDDSEAMLAAARRRLAAMDNVELRRGHLETLPVDDRCLDAALAILVLHHLPDPLAVLTRASRALKAGGKILVVDMLSHDRQDYRQSMGHVWLGFEPAQIRQWLELAGFEHITIRQKRPDPRAKGPTLFVATAQVPSQQAASTRRKS